MVNRTSKFANAFETTLTATVGDTGLIFNVSSTTGAPASPCYLVVDPDLPSKREYIYFDGTFTGTSFVTTNVVNRYLAGSAASSGITHDSGAIVRSVPTAQAFEDLHDRVGSKADTSHAHAAGDTTSGTFPLARGGTNASTAAGARTSLDVPSNADLTAHTGATTAHSATADPTASRIIVRDAAGRAKVADPSVAADIATKGYVDGAAVGVAPTYAKITATSNQTISTGSWTNLVFHSTLFESPSTFGDHANNRLVVPATGIYVVGGELSLSVPGTATLVSMRLMNGASSLGPSTANEYTVAPTGGVYLSGIHSLTSGDLITAQGRPTSSAIDVLARLWAYRIA